MIDEHHKNFPPAVRQDINQPQETPEIKREEVPSGDRVQGEAIVHEEPGREAAEPEVAGEKVAPAEELGIARAAEATVSEAKTEGPLESREEEAKPKGFDRNRFLRDSAVTYFRRLHDEFERLRSLKTAAEIRQAAMMAMAEGTIDVEDFMKIMGDRSPRRAIIRLMKGVESDLQALEQMPPDEDVERYLLEKTRLGLSPHGKSELDRIKAEADRAERDELLTGLLTEVETAVRIAPGESLEELIAETERVRQQLREEAILEKRRLQLRTKQMLGKKGKGRAEIEDEIISEEAALKQLIAEIIPAVEKVSPRERRDALERAIEQPEMKRRIKELGLSEEIVILLEAKLAQRERIKELRERISELKQRAEALWSSVSSKSVFSAEVAKNIRTIRMLQRSTRLALEELAMVEKMEIVYPEREEKAPAEKRQREEKGSNEPPYLGEMLAAAMKEKKKATTEPEAEAIRGAYLCAIDAVINEILNGSLQISAPRPKEGAKEVAGTEMDWKNFVLNQLYELRREIETADKDPAKVLEGAKNKNLITEKVYKSIQAYANGAIRLSRNQRKEYERRDRSSEIREKRRRYLSAIDKILAKIAVIPQGQPRMDPEVADVAIQLRILRNNIVAASDPDSALQKAAEKKLIDERVLRMVEEARATM